MQPTYTNFLSTIKTRIRQAQYDALRVVNQQLIKLYWDMSRMIVEKQDADGWGKLVVDQLLADLQAEFSGISGFSAGNIWNMRMFYLIYKGDEAIVEKCKDALQREFYLKMTQKFGWTKNMHLNL
jgi:rhamnogalacturonyl hydrolase YesR